MELSASTPKPRIVEHPVPLTGDARTLVDSLVIELAGEKIDLPSFPDVAMRVRKALTNEEVGIEDAVKIVSAEPALAARLMQLANSVTLNPGGKRLNNLRTAMTRIGLNMACSVTIAFAMSQLRRAETYKGVDDRLGRLWHEAAHLAAVSRVITRRFTSLNPDTALLAGLLMCIGRLYLLTRAVRFPSLLEDAAALERVSSEYHLRVAQAILRNWDMDAEIVKAIGGCGDPAREHAGTVDLTDVLIVSSALIALGPEPLPGTGSFPGMPAARRLGLDADACRAALEESRDEIEALRLALNV